MNGPWKLAQAVSVPAARFQSATTPQVSTGLHDQRGVRNRSETTRSARGEGALDVPVAERAIRDDLAGVRVGDGVERLQVELDQLERVLGDVAVTGDDDRERLAGVTRNFVGRGQVGRCVGDADGERARQTSDVGAREHADHARERERRAGSSAFTRAWANGERRMAAWPACGTGSMSSM